MAACLSHACSLAFPSSRSCASVGTSSSPRLGADPAGCSRELGFAQAAQLAHRALLARRHGLGAPRAAAAACSCACQLWGGLHRPGGSVALAAAALVTPQPQRRARGTSPSPSVCVWRSACYRQQAYSCQGLSRPLRLLPRTTSSPHLWCLLCGRVEKESRGFFGTLLSSPPPPPTHTHTHTLALTHIHLHARSPTLSAHADTFSARAFSSLAAAR